METRNCDGCGDEVYMDDLNAAKDGELFCDDCAVDIIQAELKESKQCAF